MKIRKVILTLLVVFVITVITTEHQQVYALYFGENLAEDDTEETYTYENWLYQHIGDNEVALLGYTGTKSDIEIPSKIPNEKPNREDWNVVEIERFDLKHPEKIKSIKIPNSFAEVSMNIFDQATYLEKIIVDDNHASYSTVDGILFNKNKTKILLYPQAKKGSSYSIADSVTTINDGAFNNNKYLSSVTIPESITSLSSGAFAYCKNLSSVELPNDLKYINACAFTNCPNLRSITIPESVTYIGCEAFAQCINLKSINIPDNVTDIKSGAFLGCTNLASISIPEKVTTITSNMFGRCSSLKTISMPNSITSIEFGAFEGCSNLSSISLPNSVKKIGDRVFANCTKLSSIGIPESVDTLGVDLFKNCKNLNSISVSARNTKYSSLDGVLFNKSKTTIISYPKSKKSTKYVIPNTVNSLKKNAFEDCKYLKTVTLPNKLESISETVFKNCSGLTSVSIPATVKKIEKNAFEGCKSLKTITLPNKLESISDTAFKNCSSLTSVSIPATVKIMGKDVFYNCNKLVSINVDKKNTVFSSQSGVLFNKKKTTLITYPSNKKGTSYTIPSTVKKIGRRGFRSCNNLKKVVFPKKFNFLSEGYEFDSCKKLTSISFPSELYVIGANAFNNCTSLKSIHIPRKVHSIYSKAFFDCPQLSKITVDKKNKKFTSSNGVLFNKKKTCILIYPSGKKDKTYTIPNTVVEIRKYAFRGAKYLQSVTIPKGTKIINEYAFSSCPKLKTIVMPNSINALADCITKGSPLATLYISGNKYAQSYAENYKIRYKNIATKITITASKKTVKVSKSLSLKAILKPGNAVDKIKWKVSNKKIAVVSDNGTVKGLKPGKVTVTAYTMAGYTAKITLTIKK